MHGPLAAVPRTDTPAAPSFPLRPPLPQLEAFARRHDSPRLRLMLARTASATSALLALFVLSSSPVRAQEQRLPTIVTAERMQALGEALEGVIVPLRSFTDLGPGYRPRHVEGDGAATFVRFPDGTTGWITSFSHCVRAQRIELFVDGEWVEASTSHGTVIFDLVRLDLPHGSSPPEDRALPIAMQWPSDGNVYSASGIGEGETLQPLTFGLGAPPAGDYGFYVRSLAILRNGYPIVSLDGELLAVTSMAAPDRHGGVFSIPLEMIGAWIVEWPRLDGTGGWRPEIIEETMELQTGREALEP